MLSFALVSCREDVSLNAPNGLVVILKADDMGDVEGNWPRFIQILVDDSVCAGIGLIPRNVREVSVPEIQKIAEVKQKSGDPVIEFWVHGYDHKEYKNTDIKEFFKTNYNYQYRHISLAQHFFTDTLHLTSHTFGAPFNKTQILTEEAIDKFPEINIWQHYGRTEKYNNSSSKWKDPKYKVIHETDKHISLSLDYLSYKRFEISDMLKNFEKDKQKPYIVIQIHPATWSETQFQDFKALLHFYKQNKVNFMTPYQYYNFLQKK